MFAPLWECIYPYETTEMTIMYPGTTMYPGTPYKCTTIIIFGQVLFYLLNVQCAVWDTKYNYFVHSMFSES